MTISHNCHDITDIIIVQVECFGAFMKSYMHGSSLSAIFFLSGYHSGYIFGILSAYCFCIAVVFLALHISCVMVPMGQYTHQERGLHKTMVKNPKTVEVSITL